jgi:hypothetical protein
VAGKAKAKIKVKAKGKGKANAGAVELRICSSCGSVLPLEPGPEFDRWLRFRFESILEQLSPSSPAEHSIGQELQVEPSAGI